MLILKVIQEGASISDYVSLQHELEKVGFAKILNTDLKSSDVEYSFQIPASVSFVDKLAKDAAARTGRHFSFEFRNQQ